MLRVLVRALALWGGVALAPGCLVDSRLYSQLAARFADGDRDGWSPADGDCDDGDARSHPGAIERCDGRDNDCDGGVDRGAIDGRWWPDADGDGVGADGPGTETCTPPAGWVAQSGDCDDGAASVSPAAAERCGGPDENCDGALDVGAVDAVAWSADADADGYGAGAEIRACVAPGPGYAPLGGDCDDTRAEVHPAAPESCNGEDDDCDGIADEEPLLPDSLTFPDADGDGHGAIVPGACVLGAGRATRSGDCADDDPTAFPGAPVVCNNGQDDDCDADPADCPWAGAVPLSRAVLVRSVASGVGLGAAAATGDLDGDGVPELILGGPRSAGVAGLDGGDVWAWGASPATERRTDAVAWQRAGSASGGAFGAGLVVADVDGDAQADLIVGAPGRGSGAGEVFLFYGPLGSFGADTAADARAVGRAADALGGVLAAGELDGRAGVELASGNPTWDGRGAVRVLAPGGGAAVAEWAGSGAGARVGAALCSDDLDGDGVDDLAVGAPGAAGGRGLVAVWRGPLSGARTEDDGDWQAFGEVGGSKLGAALACLGDADGDGLPELLAGAPEAGDGVAYLLAPGGADEVVPAADARLRWRGDTTARGLGTSVGPGPDRATLGVPSVVLGDGAAGRGRVWVDLDPAGLGVRGAADVDVVIEASAATDRAFAWALAPGDLTGDGVPDLAFGSGAWGGGSRPDGRAWVLAVVGD